MVGVNYKVVGTTGNNNASTDHYVNIVGMGVDEHKRYYFSYYDNYADPYIFTGLKINENSFVLI